MIISISIIITIIIIIIIMIRYVFLFFFILLKLLCCMTPFNQDSGQATNLGQTGCEKHTLVQLPHLLKEVIHVRPLQYIHLVDGSVYFNRNYEISIADWLKARNKF